MDFTITANVFGRMSILDLFPFFIFINRIYEFFRIVIKQKRKILHLGEEISN